jgi:hypothetical protein
MGYTTYWRRKSDFTVEQWNKIKNDVLDVIVHCDKKNIPLALEYDVPNSGPRVNGSVIQFNGVGEDGHETFIVSRKMPEAKPWMLSHDLGESFDFCKTARKPYDLAVCLTLLACVRHAPNSVRISSDGDWEEPEWVEARTSFKELFGVEVQCPFFEEAA